MAFTNANWTCVSASLSQGQQIVTPFEGSSTILNAPNIFMYGSPNDIVSVIHTANYFLTKYASLNVGDWIMGYGTDGSFIFQVTSSSPTSVTVINVLGTEPLTIVVPTNNTILVTQPSPDVFSVASNYQAGTGITITGNVIAATGGGGSTIVEATDDTITVTNPSTGVYSIAATPYTAGSGITIADFVITATGGGGGFVGYPSYPINLDDEPTGTFTIHNNLPAEITFTTTGIGATIVAPPDYTMETQQTYLPVTITNSLSSTVPFGLGVNLVYPGQSYNLYPTNYTSSDGGVIAIGYPISRPSRVNGGSIVVTLNDNNSIIYASNNGGNASIILPDTSNLPENFTTYIVIQGIVGSTFSYTFMPNGSDTVAGTNGLGDTFNFAAGIYFLELVYAGGSSLSTWVYNFNPANEPTIHSFFGNPNGNVAGLVNDLSVNVAGQTLYLCILAGDAASAQWVLVGGYQAGSGISISNSTISATGGSIPSFTGVAYNTAGTLTAATPSQVTTAALLNPNLVNIFQASGDINLDDTSGQTLLIGSGSTGTNLYMPDPTSTNPWAEGRPYLVMMAKTAPSFIFEQMNVRNFGGVQIVDIFGLPITMTPCDNWIFWFNGTAGVGYLLSNNATETQSYMALGQWFSTTGATIPTIQQTFSSTVVYGPAGMLYVNYVIPAFYASLLAPSSFVFQTTSQTNFPVTAFPGSTSQGIPVINSSINGVGLVTVDRLAVGGQVLVNGNTGGGDFGTGNVVIGPISIMAPITLPF